MLLFNLFDLILQLRDSFWFGIFFNPIKMTILPKGQIFKSTPFFRTVSSLSICYMIWFQIAVLKYMVSRIFVAKEKCSYKNRFITGNRNFFHISYFDILIIFSTKKVYSFSANEISLFALISLKNTFYCLVLINFILPQTLSPFNPHETGYRDFIFFSFEIKICNKYGCHRTKLMNYKQQIYLGKDSVIRCPSKTHVKFNFKDKPKRIHIINNELYISGTVFSKRAFSQGLIFRFAVTQHKLISRVLKV